MTPGSTQEVEDLNRAMEESGINAGIAGQLPESHRGEDITKAVEDFTAEAEATQSPPILNQS